LDKQPQIVSKEINKEMHTSFLEYAMSVIKDRALPDVRDGLKPCSRRLLYSMLDLGVFHNKPFLKSARIVGNTMGKFHPHGDMGIYLNLVRLTQDFIMRYPLILGQGNFGTLEDAPAASRYTEAKLSAIGELLLQDLEKDTVDFMPNYDEKELEPTVLPSAFPSLIVNGIMGLAVGMATNMPPHNLSETIDALQLLIGNPSVTLEELMKVLPGPDFPTGGYICGRSGIADAYRTGRGKVVMRAKVNVEEWKNGREAVIVTELPYQVNKGQLIESIAEQIKEKRLVGASDVRDESDRDGMRVVIEVRRGENTNVLINQLFAQTKMEDSFGVIQLALVDNKPKYLSLKQLLEHFLAHRKEVITRRSKFDLTRAENRLHIVQGLLIALNNIDNVVKIIRTAEHTDAARSKLMVKYKLSEIQANAILDMPLRRLVMLETSKLEAEDKELNKTINYLRKVIGTPNLVLEIVSQELNEIKEKFGDPRKTEIIDSTTNLKVEDLIKNEPVIVTITHEGYIKRVPTNTYHNQNRGGVGVQGASTKEEDWVEHLFVGTTHDYLMCFTDKGKAHWLKIYEVPEGNRTTRGKSMINLIQIEAGEKIQAVIPVKEFVANQFLVFVTEKGQVIKNQLSLYDNPRKTGIKAIKMDSDDKLCQVLLTNGSNELFIATAHGMAVRFNEANARASGRDSSGVRGITLKDDDKVVGTTIAQPGTTILTICKNGFGKRSEIESYRLIRRGGSGVKNIKLSEKNGDVIAIMNVLDNDNLMLMTQNGMTVRLAVKNVRCAGRVTQGIRLINLKNDDLLVGAEKISE
jgi:DNA gyrase subunit A